MGNLREIPVRLPIVRLTSAGRNGKPGLHEGSRSEGGTDADGRAVRIPRRGLHGLPVVS